MNKPCQPSPLNSSNSEIFRNKVPSQFTNNTFPPKRQEKKDLAISNSQKKKNKQTKGKLTTWLQCKRQPLFKGKS